MKKIAVLSLFALVTLVGYAAAQPDGCRSPGGRATGPGAVLGTVTITATPYGTLFTPNLSGLTPGIHGFHVHEHPSCAPMDKYGKPVPSLGAGGHYDPAKTGKHLGPYGDGHLGDLPPLYVDAQGSHPAGAGAAAENRGHQGSQPDGARGRRQFFRSTGAAGGRRRAHRLWSCKIGAPISARLG